MTIHPGLPSQNHAKPDDTQQPTCHCGRTATHGRYCRPCLDTETEWNAIPTEDLQAAADFLDHLQIQPPTPEAQPMTKQEWQDQNLPMEWCIYDRESYQEFERKRRAQGEDCIKAHGQILLDFRAPPGAPDGIHPILHHGNHQGTTGGVVIPGQPLHTSQHRAHGPRGRLPLLRHHPRGDRPGREPAGPRVHREIRLAPGDRLHRGQNRLLKPRPIPTGWYNGTTPEPARARSSVAELQSYKLTVPGSIPGGRTTPKTRRRTPPMPNQNQPRYPRTPREDPVKDYLAAALSTDRIIPEVITRQALPAPVRRPA